MTDSVPCSAPRGPALRSLASANDEGPRLTREEYQAYSPMIRTQAMVLVRRAGGLAPADQETPSVADLCVVGFAGLFDALRSHASLGEGMPLRDYVFGRVRSAMMERLLVTSPERQALRARSRDIVRTLRMLGPNVTSRETLAEALSMRPRALDALLVSLWRAGFARIDLLPFDAQTELDEPPEVASLAAAIQALPLQMQRILMLVHQRACSMNELAMVLGVAEDEAAADYAEAIHRCRASLGRE